MLGSVLLSIRHLHSHPSHVGDRVRIGDELIALGRQLGRLSMTLGGHHALAAARLERGDVNAWRDGFDRFTELLGDHSLAFFQIQAINHRANRALLAGDLAGAETIAAETVPLSVGIGAGRDQRSGRGGRGHRERPGGGSRRVRCCAVSGRIAVSGPYPSRPFDQVLAQAALAIDQPATAVRYADRALEASGLADRLGVGIAIVDIERYGLPT